MQIFYKGKYASNSFIKKTKTVKNILKNDQFSEEKFNENSVIVHNMHTKIHKNRMLKKTINFDIL